MDRVYRGPGDVVWEDALAVFAPGGYRALGFGGGAEDEADEDVQA